MNPFLVQAAAGVLGGLLGGGQGRLSPEQQFQMGIARDFRRFGKSAPGSDPGEQAALANNQAMLGQQMNQVRQGLYSQMPANVVTSPADMTQSIASNEMAQRMALNAQAMMQAMEARRQAMMQAAGIAQGIGPRQQPNNIGQMLGGLAQTYTAYQGARQGQQNWQDMLAAIRGAQTQGVQTPPSGMSPPMIGAGSLAQTPGIQGMGPNPPMLGSRQPLAPQGGANFNPAMGMPRPNGGSGVPMMPPPDAGYGNPTQNWNAPQNTLDLYSNFKGGRPFGFPGLNQSGVR